MNNSDDEKIEKLELHIACRPEDDFRDILAYADKRKGIVWTPEEEEILVEGLKKYGKGHWKQILDSFKDDLNPNRRMKDLSDKVRILEKQTTYQKRSKQDWWEVDQNNNPVCKMGEKVIYRAKLPYEAAFKCAYTKNYTSGETKYIKICYEEAGKFWYHLYIATYHKNENARNRIKVRKISGQSPYRKDGM
ncbi:hypothetical protein NCER_100273 [Vairimorpha ceranae BRL01]|uniref:Uncharacterized protein n=2 Tax=Vairimorpha ceranae TaxID=40302 RepID=C4V756_VAIC1|nr:myb-like dna-binding domain containing protein [Vairimorpha ceranae]EEQ82942.1 hypothetical protein NCER_100273 [Vairimorpha ceranae BRL01]KAF5141483.1 hypothetical protein G9O61_00g003460 [Vairimorpha ceranae]KKO76216.1 myb-like dna-binding domain containing protein [Vairimorpha ceranae]